MAHGIKRRLFRARGGFSGYLRQRIRKLRTRQAEDAEKAALQGATGIEGMVDSGRNALLIAAKAGPAAEVGRQVQENVGRAVAQRTRESRREALQATERRTVETRGGMQDVIAMVALGAADDPHLHRATERCRATDIGVARVRARDLDEIKRRCGKREIAGDGQGAGRGRRVTGCKRAGDIRVRVDGAGARQSGTRIDLRGGSNRAVDLQRAAADGGRTGIGIDA